MDFNKFGTKLGDLNAYLADAYEGRSFIDDCLTGHEIIDDIENAYKISNELYTEFVKFDTKKRQEANT